MRFGLGAWLALEVTTAHVGAGAREGALRADPLLDMTFIHEGNRTLVENLINFEKMVSMESSLPWGLQSLSAPSSPPWSL